MNIMNYEDFKRTMHKCTYEEFTACACGMCARDCIHRDAYRRYPVNDNGCGECPRLKEMTDGLNLYKVTYEKFGVWSMVLCYGEDADVVESYMWSDDVGTMSIMGIPDDQITDVLELAREKGTPIKTATPSDGACIY